MKQLSDRDLQHITIPRLQTAMQHGILKVMIQPAAYPEFVMSDHGPNREDFSDLEGHPISISAGARKYRLKQPTISRWISRGLLSSIGKEKNRILVDEADLAYMAAVFHKFGGMGKKVF